MRKNSQPAKIKYLLPLIFIFILYAPAFSSSLQVKDTAKAQIIKAAKSSNIDTTLVKGKDTTRVLAKDTSKVQLKDSTKVQPKDTLNRVLSDSVIYKPVSY